MTRRDRLIRILDNFGDLRGVSVIGSHCWIAPELDRLMRRHRYDLFTDDAIEMLAWAVIKDWRNVRRMNQQNRKLRAFA